jgi:hypothetical protein
MAQDLQVHRVPGKSEEVLAGVVRPHQLRRAEEEGRKRPGPKEGGKASRTGANVIKLLYPVVTDKGPVL